MGNAFFDIIYINGGRTDLGKFFEYWKMAFFNIRSNKVRAFLTMLGIIIGISSVIMMMDLFPMVPAVEMRQPARCL